MKKLSIIVAMVMALFLMLAGFGYARSNVELKMIAAWPVNIIQTHWYHGFSDLVNERAEKQGIPLRIKKMGGPEIVAPMQQFEAMRTGMVDMALHSGDYISGQCPELTAVVAIALGKGYLKVLRDTKVMDIINAAAREKAKIRALAQVTFRGYTLLSTKPVKGADWSGLKIRAFSKQTAGGIEGLGGASVFMPPAEVFQALQKGIIDGAFRSCVDALGFGERNIYKYVVDPPCTTGAAHIYISTRAWDSLPDSTKAFLKDVSRDIEDMSFVWNMEKSAEALETFVKEDGVKVVALSPEDQRKAAKAFRADYLDYLAEKFPKYGVQLKNLLKSHVW